MVYVIQNYENWKTKLTKIEGGHVWLGAPENIFPLCQRLPAFTSFYSLKSTFNNKLSDGIGSLTVLNKGLHLCKYNRSYVKSFLKIHAIIHLPTEG